MSDWTKLPPIAPDGAACLNCGPKSARLKMSDYIGVGFGYAACERDGEPVWIEQDFNDAPTAMRFENMARKDPDHDWRVVIHGPLSGATYQRHGRNDWPMVEKNQGFA